MFGNPTLDLLASSINHQIDRCIFWKPDLKALAIHPFSIKWNTEFYYIFPPFSFLGKVTAKIYKDKTKAIAVVPKRPKQQATKSMTISLPANNLVQPQDPEKVHPLHQKLRPQVLLID